MGDAHDWFGLAGKKALIVGGGRGMGRSSALMLARAGCEIAILDSAHDRAEEVAAELRELGCAAVPIVADILDGDAVDRTIGEVDDRLGGLDVVVTIVGQALFKPLVEITLEEWDAEQARNLRYVFAVARAAAARMIARGQGGAFVHVASVDGLVGSPGHVAYGVAKAGLAHFVKSAAAEWGRLGIRVNAVAPGSITTPRLPETAESRAFLDRSVLPMGRSGTTDDIGGAVLFLASSLAAYVTGQVLAVDGGYLAANIFDPRVTAVKQSK